MTDDTSNPFDYPERPEVRRERVRRIAALAAECGEVVRVQPVDEGSAPDAAASPPPPPDAPSSVEEVLVRDDLDAALRFFAAARAEAVDASDPAAPASQTGETTLDFSRYRARRIRERLIVLLDALVAAVERRDLQSVWDVLDETDACRCFPPAVREEALVLAGLPKTVHRPPVRLYRYYHMLHQLGDEPLEPPTDADQLSMPLSEGEPSPPPHPGGRAPLGRTRDGSGRRRTGHR